MHYLDNYKTFNCFKIIFVNLDGLPSTMTLARTMIKHPKGWKRYRNACKKKYITTSRAVFYKDIIYVADRKKFSDKSNLRIILKGLKCCNGCPSIEGLKHLVLDLIPKPCCCCNGCPSIEGLKQ